MGRVSQLVASALRLSSDTRSGWIIVRINSRVEARFLPIPLQWNNDSSIPETGQVNQVVDGFIVPGVAECRKPVIGESLDWAPDQRKSGWKLVFEAISGCVTRLKAFVGKVAHLCRVYKTCHDTPYSGKELRTQRGKEL
jgi:hypothetical protein